MSEAYEVVFRRGSSRPREDLPEKVAAAAFEFIMGARRNPHGVGKPLREPLAPLFAARRGEYRVIYRIVDARLVVAVVSISHRRDTYHDLFGATEEPPVGIEPTTYSLRVNRSTD